MQIPTKPHKPQRSLTLLIVAAVFVMVMGAMAITGWLVHIEAFASIFANYVTMKFNTGLGFILEGAAFLFLLQYNSPLTKGIFTAVTLSFGLLGLATLSQEIFHWSVGIDQFFVNDPKTAVLGLGQPGRMSQSTAFCFAAMSIGFFCVDNRRIWVRKFGQVIFHIVTCLAFIAFIGYLLKVPNAFKLVFFTSMAINTAFCFIVISVAAATINYDLGITSLFTGIGIGNIVARKLFPRMVIILVLLGFLRIQMERANIINDELGVVLSTVAFILISLFLLWGALTEMNKVDQLRTKAEEETQMLNKNLEDKVLERTLDLEQSNERFIKILNSHSACVAVSNVQTGKYVDVNPALLNMLGYTLEEIIGNTAAGLGVITAQYRQYMVDSLEKNGYIRNEDIVLICKDGTEKNCILTAEFLEYKDEKFMITFVYDITERKKTENNLKETKQSLEVLSDKLTNQNKQLLSFAHIISHNLRSPVANLNLLVHFYKESESAEDRNDLWGNFETVVGHLNVTLDELLETLRIQEDIGKEREKLSFDKVFKGISDILIGQVMESKAVIKSDFSKCGDVLYPKIYLESIILNLISNAIKYRSPERVPEIMICSSDTDGEICLTVEDNGLGIDLVRHGKNMFGMRKTFHRHAEAKGLGLFITKTQVEAMGGEITVESAVNKGTKFKVIFNKNYNKK